MSDFTFLRNGSAYIPSGFRDALGLRGEDSGIRWHVEDGRLIGTPGHARFEERDAEPCVTCNGVGTVDSLAGTEVCPAGCEDGVAA